MKKLPQETCHNRLTSHVPYKVHPSLGLPNQRNPDVAQSSDIVPSRRAPVPQNGHTPFRQYDLADAPILNNPQGFHDGNEFRVGHQPRILASSHNRNPDVQDRVLPSIENSSSQNRPGSGLREGIPRGLPIRSVTPQRPPRQEDLHDTGGDNFQFPKRRIAYYEPVNGDSRSGIAPGVVESVVSDVLKDTPTGARYVPYEISHPENHSSREDPQLRRKFVAPTGFPSAERWPQKHRDPPIHANPSSELERRVDGQRVYPTHSHPAKVSTGSYAFPLTSAHAVAVDDSPRRSMQVSFDPKAPPVYHGDQDYSRSRPLEFSQTQVPTWRNRDDEHFADVSNRRHLYADDFVRPVGLYEPEPPEYTMQRPRVAETSSHPSRLRVYDGKHKDGLIDARTPVTYHDHRPLDRRAEPLHGYATFEDPHRPLGSDRVFEPSSAPGLYHKQRYEGSLDSARYGHDARAPFLQKTTDFQLRSYIFLSHLTFYSLSFSIVTNAITGLCTAMPRSGNVLPT